jgi:hypothetical protein
MRDLPPSLVFAVIGQAKADGKMTPEDESDTLASLLSYWAARSSMRTTAICAEHFGGQVTAAVS